MLTQMPGKMKQLHHQHKKDSLQNQFQSTYVCWLTDTSTILMMCRLCVFKFLCVYIKICNIFVSGCVLYCVIISLFPPSSSAIMCKAFWEYHLDSNPPISITLPAIGRCLKSAMFHVDQGVDLKSGKRGTCLQN